MSWAAGSRAWRVTGLAQHGITHAPEQRSAYVPLLVAPASCHAAPAHPPSGYQLPATCQPPSRQPHLSRTMFTCLCLMATASWASLVTPREGGVGGEGGRGGGGGLGAGAGGPGGKGGGAGGGDLRRLSGRGRGTRIVVGSCCWCASTSCADERLRSSLCAMVPDRHSPPSRLYELPPSSSPALPPQPSPAPPPPSLGRRQRRRRGRRRRGVDQDGAVGWLDAHFCVGRGEVELGEGGVAHVDVGAPLFLQS